MRGRLGTRPEPAAWPSVVAVVPARDEAAILPDTLPALLAQDYPGEFRVVLVDDASTDGTGALAEFPGRGSWSPATAHRRAGPARSRPSPPVSHRQANRTTCCSPTPTSGIRPAACAPWSPWREADNRDLVSLMARLRTDSAWERAIVPAFVYFFAQLYPFGLVNKSTSRVAAAAGGCVLVRRERPRGGRWPGADRRRADRRRRAGRTGQTQRQRPDLARPEHGRGQPAAVSETVGPVGHGGAQRLHATALLARAAGRHRDRAAAAVRAAAGRAGRRPRCPHCSVGWRGC